MHSENIWNVDLLSANQLPAYAEVIRRSFATVAQEFGWTRKSAPTHTAFISDDKLADKIKAGYYPFGLFIGEDMVGFVSLTDMGGGIYELNHLAILPEWRHYGYGKMLLAFCKDKVCECGDNKIQLAFVEENTMLKNWYATNGFVHTGTKKIDGLPFTVGFMEWKASRS